VTGPQFPIYIVSKGRWESRLTAKALTKLGVPFWIVVEAAERDAYAAVIDPTRVLVLDPVYQARYDTFDHLGDTKSKGPGPARNFAWDHAISIGAAWHWVMDDNIWAFYRFNRNNEDTDLSLRMLKKGWCTVLFNAFLQKKTWTQAMKGGNTAAFYAAEGTLPKSQMQVAMHPDVSRLVWKFGRWHHLVDYKSFAGNILVLRDGVALPDGPDNYGMVLHQLTAKDANDAALAPVSKRSS
jgi:hypothetical protein